MLGKRNAVLSLVLLCLCCEGWAQLPGPIEIAPGPSGAVGHTGATGPVGKAGPPGPDGRPGRSGASGGPGDPGQNGLPGRRGDTGVAGRKGVAGARGFPGRTGVPGPPGRVGATGMVGPVGPSATPAESGEVSSYELVSLIWLAILTVASIVIAVCCCCLKFRKKASLFSWSAPRVPAQPPVYVCDPTTKTTVESHSQSVVIPVIPVATAATSEDETPDSPATEKHEPIYENTPSSGDNHVYEPLSNRK